MKKFAALFFAFSILFFNLSPSVLAEEIVEENNEEIIEEQGQEEAVMKVILNEVLANPKEAEAENEFIEIYNAGEMEVDLTGWQLDDENLEDETVYVFDNPELNYVLAPGAYLTLFRPETDLTLNNDGDAVYLFDAENNEVDSFVFEETFSGYPWARFGEEMKWTLLPQPTPNEENVFENQTPVAVIELQGGTGDMQVNLTGENSYDPEDHELSYVWEFEPGIFIEKANPTSYEFQTEGTKTIYLTVTDFFGATHQNQIMFEAKKEVIQEPEEEIEDELPDEEEIDYPQLNLIHEFLPNPAGPDTGFEWIELYNDSNEILDISGWYLDDEEGASSPFKIPENTVLSAKDFRVFGGEELGLSLKNSNDVVRLLNPKKEESERIEYEAALEDFSNAKNEEGKFIWTPILTPGSQNDFPPPPKSYTLGTVIFQSILPNPQGTDTGKERVNLKNLSNETIDLSAWKLIMGSKEKPLENLTLESNGTLILNPADVGLTLKNTDANIALIDPAGNVIDQIKWKTSLSGEWIFNPNNFIDDMQAKVIEVLDGDTLKIEYEGGQLTLRLLGVDTPETIDPTKPVQYYGKQASDYLKEKLIGKTVDLKFEENKIDAYGRLLSYVYLDGQFINAEIIKEGYGYAYTKFPFKYLDEFVAYQKEAEQMKRGLWGGLKDEYDEEKPVETKEEVEKESEEEIYPELDKNTAETKINPEEDEKVSNINCDSDFLKIKSLVPNPNKGEEEYITLVNTGQESICLEGWKLDDIKEGGSKPFTILEGSIETGRTAKFSKEITKISLNNSNDCATLIRPSGEVADEICYEKTQTGEVLNSEGKSENLFNNEAEKQSSVQKSEQVKNTIKHTFNRESSSYRSELINNVYKGKIIGLDEAGEIIIMELENQKIISISYANSLFKMSEVKNLIELSKPVEAKVYENRSSRNLISLHSDYFSATTSSPKKWFYPSLFIVVGLGTFLALKGKNWSDLLNQYLASEAKKQDLV